VILNAYAVLDAFVSLLRLGLALPVVWLACAAWQTWRQAALAPDARKALEDRCYLLYLLGCLSLALNVLSWPVFYLLLESYVTEWPGLTCVYGVTRVGAGSVGSSRFLPPLLAALQTSKPLLVFLSGAWFVLYLINRQTRTAPLTGRVLLLILAAGLLGGADAAAELAYLLIPKKEEFLASGCCTAAFAEYGPTRFVPKRHLGEAVGAWLSLAYYAANAGMILLLGWCARLSRRRLPAGWLAALFVAALVCLAVSAAFLIEVSPRLLHLPGHYCPYDLASRAPRSLAAVALCFAGTFFAGWGCVAGWLGGGPESEPFAAGTAGSLFRLGVFGYAFSVLVLSLELAVA
jgi:hypothetical protein